MREDGHSGDPNERRGMKDAGQCQLPSPLIVVGRLTHPGRQQDEAHCVHPVAVQAVRYESAEQTTAI